DKAFSRIHFLIEMNPPHCRLLDMGSRNGTAINGRKVHRADLQDGDYIQAGRTIMQVAIENEATEALTPAMPPPRSEQATQQPEEIPGYRISQELGRGGMGVV